MSDKWKESRKEEFNRQAAGRSQGSEIRENKGSKQIKNTQHGLKNGPPPPKGPGMAIARDRHREAMAGDHDRAVGGQQALGNRKNKKPVGKGDLKKDFDKSR